MGSERPGRAGYLHHDILKTPCHGVVGQVPDLPSGGQNGVFVAGSLIGARRAEYNSAGRLQEAAEKRVKTRSLSLAVRCQ